MKNPFITKICKSLIFLAAALAAFALPARAQSDRLISADVPFNFYVKDRAFPAGSYTVALIQITGADALKIQSADGRITAIIPTRGATARVTSRDARLVFNRYEDHYFLSQVFGLEDEAAQTVAKSRTEDALAKSVSAPERRSVAATARRH